MISRNNKKTNQEKKNLCYVTPKETHDLQQYIYDLLHLENFFSMF